MASNNQPPSSIEVPFDPSKAQPDVLDVIKNIQVNELSPANIARLPCAKNALLYGIAGGLSLSAARFLATKRVRSAGNWGVLAFAGISIASWEMCRLQRRMVQQQLANLATEQALLQQQQAQQQEHNEFLDR